MTESCRFFCTLIYSLFIILSSLQAVVSEKREEKRSATSIGANINEAVYGNSKADFIAKLHIALKETGESIYWLTLLSRTHLLDYDYSSLLALAEEIKRMLIASLNTAKSRSN